MMRHLVIFCTAVFVAACATPFDLQGHRGTRGLRPENTLPAFAKALEIGVDTLELDTNITRDGVIVVMHDRRLNPDVARGPDGRWVSPPGLAIHQLTYAELSRYDVGRLRPGTDYAKEFPEQLAIDGTHPPRLSDVFALVRTEHDRRVRFNIETKISPKAPDESPPPEEFARRLVDEIRAAGMQRRSTIESFDWRTLAVVQRIAPEIPAVYLTYKMDDAVAKVRDAGGKIWSPFYKDVDEAKIREAHAAGIEVVVWTVNDPADMKRMVEWGVDGLITDRPDVFHASVMR
ncbi:MAG TPA: glycerophosphodiester phosphodiesterase [Usitatibacter sp.]|nr:glycerophosphodiester phosphodiesterase [Usitatibacter sp.]